MFAQLASGLGNQRIKHWLHELELLGQCLVIPDVLLSSGVQLLAVQRCHCVGLGEALEYRYFVILPGALLIGFQA